ncbi:MAG TPA: glycosyltransferase family 2 protein [Usitatibacter sp.]|jgi:undecaprenyl-phosphate 4-deoxy-4-formamido-L-arabinose transferase|nr:glycosyltransferase family 2 protein [Usitatibacter sp.]
MSNSSPEVSIVVPVYRSETILPRLAEEVLEAMKARGWENAFELILVNDVSPDDSWEVVKKLATRYPFVHGVALAGNVGQHNASMAGLGQARGEVVVIMDDDLQHPPEAVGSMVDAIRSGFDVCYTRYVNRQHNLWKRFGSWINDRVATILLKKPSGLYLSSFKAMHRRIVDEVVKYDGPYAYIDGILLDITRRVTVVPIGHRARLEGEGNYNLARSVSLWLKMATSFSVLPLRIASVVGAVTSFASGLLIVGIVVEKLLHPETPRGWTSLAALILFMGGVQLLSLGIIGEYVGRSYMRLNRKPQYVIRELTDTATVHQRPRPVAASAPGGTP